MDGDGDDNDDDGDDRDLLTEMFDQGCSTTSSITRATVCNGM